jgi:hypothetical protein
MAARRSGDEKRLHFFDLDLHCDSSVFRLKAVDRRPYGLMGNDVQPVQRRRTAKVFLERFSETRVSFKSVSIATSMILPPCDKSYSAYSSFRRVTYAMIGVPVSDANNRQKW